MGGAFIYTCSKDLLNVCLWQGVVRAWGYSSKPDLLKVPAVIAHTLVELKAEDIKQIISKCANSKISMMMWQSMSVGGLGAGIREKQWETTLDGRGFSEDLGFLLRSKI